MPKKINGCISVCKITRNHDYDYLCFTLSCWLVRLRNWTSSACFFSSISRRSASRLSMASHLAFCSFNNLSKSRFSLSNSKIYQQFVSQQAENGHLICACLVLHWTFFLSIQSQLGLMLCWTPLTFIISSKYILCVYVIVYDFYYRSKIITYELVKNTNYCKCHCIG